MTRKKRVRQSKHQQEPGKEGDSSDDDSPSLQSNNGCPHINKAINGSSLKKAIKNNTFKSGECQSCSTDPQTQCASVASNDKGSVSDQDSVDQEKTLWLCLQCGYQGCGRTSSSKHALLHHQTPHSDPHDLVVNPDNWAIWCYKCDDEVGVDSNRRLADCVDILKKHFAKTASKQSAQSSSKQAMSLPKVNLDIQALAPAPAPSPAPAKTAPKNVEESSKPSPKKPINGLRPETTNVMKVKGLSNLGNTCFFNAVLQSLSQCRYFVGVLRDQCYNGKEWHIDLLPEQRLKEKDSVDVTLGSCGALTDSLLKFLDEMEQSSQKKNGVISPAQLFRRVCEKASQFRGFQQQDSHELLRYLLDAVRNEEIKRQRISLLRTLGLEKVPNKDIDEKTRAALKALSSVTSFTVIEKVFEGQLVSTVQCEECHISSQVFETFMDLCLPIFEEKPSRPGLHKRSNSTEKVDDSHEGGVVYQKTDNSKPSRHQEKKMKRLQKREVKKQLKSQKHLASVVSLESEGNTQAENVPEKETEEGEDGDVHESNKDEQLVSDNRETDSVASVFPDMDVYVTEADVEDNDETSSHTSSKSQNESDLSSLSPSETVCASGSTTVESDLTTTETIEDSTTQALEIGYLCKQVASLDLNHQQNENKEGFVIDSSTVASGLTSPSSVEIISTDSGIVGSSTDSGIFRTNIPASSARATQKCNQRMITTSLMPLAPPCKLASQECSLLSSLHQFTMRELLVGNNKFGCENCSRKKAERSGIKSDEKMPMVYTNASKQLLISSPPAVLTLQLKRFQQVGRNVTKVNRYVEFPVLLDIGPFCSRLALALPHVQRGQHQIIYSLVGVVEHSGKLTGGHYTAFVKVQPSQEQTAKYPFLNQVFRGEKELQHLIEEVERKHDMDSSWEMYSDLGDDVKSLFEEKKTCEVPPGKWYHVSDSHVSEVSESTVLRCKAYLLFYERIV